ncbi:DUF4397 domain-containing protein [Intrasporangium flavum]|uniref:DUF4397 domain-containing protein n=1 Tax=Intrasporangium flavum TaxID=1428657 RepID=UPI00096E6CFB|nr:DUF4397 domain-containing protein [Intrasporangium flavum]
MDVRRRSVIGAAVLMTTAGLGAWADSSYAAQPQATIYVVQGLPGRTVDVTVDGAPRARAMAGATLSPAIGLPPGRHTISFSDRGSHILDRTVDLKNGSSSDVVLHLPVNPAGAPTVTMYDNATDPLPAGKAALVVAHTAAVPPADVRVDGKVLFANIANGESLDLVVPAGTYAVDIVPAGASSPVVLGPLDLPVKAGSLNRVFAVGDPASSSMRVVVQVLPVGRTGSGAPGRVDTGTGGQADATSSLSLGSLAPRR